MSATRNALGSPPDSDVYRDRMRAAEGSLSPALLRVAKFIDRNRVAVVGSSAAELGGRIGTSDATVIRAVQSLGFGGLAELRQALMAKLETPATPADNMRRTLKEVGHHAQTAIDDVLETHRGAIQALQSARSRARITAAVTALNPAERIVVFGIGPSAPLARYLSILFRRNGRASAPLDATGTGLADQLLDLRAGDALLLMAYGRPYREVIVTLDEGRRLNLPVVLVTDTETHTLARRADVVVLARRGRADRVAIHAATLAALEAIVLGLAACDRTRALAGLDRLNDLRAKISGTRMNVD